MFSESADLYDKIYTRLKDYREEARIVVGWIKRVCPDARTVLDVACGTGEHDRFLSADYQVDGIDFVEPWFTPEMWSTGVLHMTNVDEDQFKLCRMNISERRDPRLSSFTFHYLVGTPTGITYVTEDHKLGLFTGSDMQEGFAAAGLSVQYDEHGIAARGLYIAQPRLG